MAITEAENQLIDKLTKKLMYYRSKNSVPKSYYDMKNMHKNLNIALPKAVADLDVKVPWGRIVVESTNERVNLDGFTDPDELGVTEIYNQNYLDLKSKQAHREAFIYGMSYILVGAGREDLNEPKSIMTVESPNTTVALISPRTGEIDSLLKVTMDGKQFSQGELFTKTETILFSYSAIGEVFLSNPATENTNFIGSYEEIDRDEHDFGVVTAAQLMNMPEPSDWGGSSLITPSVRGFCDSGVRTYIGAEIARETGSAPQRYLLNVDLSQFKDKDGRPTKAWDTYMGKILMAGPNQDKTNPIVGQFPATSPEPFLKLIRSYREEISAETGIPVSQLGETSTNPAAADAIRAGETKLIKRAEDAADAFEIAWLKAVKFALMIKNNGRLPDGTDKIRAIWRDAGSPTRAADTDAAVKLVQSGILQANSEVLYSRLGFTEAEKRQAREEFQAAKKDALIESITAMADKARTDATVNQLNGVGNGGTTTDTNTEVTDDEALISKYKVKTQQYTALGMGVRAGADEEYVAADLGFENYKSSGGLPVSLKFPSEAKSDLETFAESE